MIKFWEQAATSLSARLFSAGEAALAFWLWAVTLWSIPRGGWSYLQGMLRPLFEVDRATVLLAVLVALVIVVWTSGLVVERLTLPILRLLEGYWPPFAESRRDKMIGRWQEKVGALESENPDASVPSEQSPAQVRVHRFPLDKDFMPTRIGNILRGGERHPYYWYGLDAVIVWPHLWLLLPEQVRGDLAQARSQLDRAVAAFIWAVLGCVVVLAYWIVWVGQSPAVVMGVFAIGVLLSAATAWAIWRWWIPNAAENYATLIIAVFDTHRFALYDALHYPRPKSPAQEKKLGEALTTSLWSSLHSAPPKYTGD